jgi:hypothetical protein
MRPRLLLLVAAIAAAALTSGPAAAGAASSLCTAAGTGRHVRTQVVKVKLTGTCPSTGTASGTLTFHQWPHIRGRSAFTLDYATATLTTHVPRRISLKPAWTANHTSGQLDLSLTATPRRHLRGRGRMTIKGGFKARHGSIVVRWNQTVTATTHKVMFGSVHVRAHLPGTVGVVLAVHEVREYCATNKTCPFAQRTSTEKHAYPANFVRATLDTAHWFHTGPGTMRSGLEQTTVLLMSKRSGKILGRSDFQAFIRID